MIVLFWKKLFLKGKTQHYKGLYFTFCNATTNKLYESDIGIMSRSTPNWLTFFENSQQE